LIFHLSEVLSSLRNEDIAVGRAKKMSSRARARARTQKFYF